MKLKRARYATGIAESLPTWADGRGNHGPVRCATTRLVRLILAGTAQRVIALAATLLVLAILGPPTQARAADAPEHLVDNVESAAREHCDGPVDWARYVATSADSAADLLGKSRDQLRSGTPDRVYLVVMHGDFSLEPNGERRTLRAPYLAFLFWYRDEYWGASDFTLLLRPVPMESAGVPQAIESFALSHPLLQRVLEYALGAAVLFGPAVLLVICAILCAWRRESGWLWVLAACLAVAIASWQTYAAVRSVQGQAWDPVFHGSKFGVLAVAVGVDLAAAVVALRTRPRPNTTDQAGTGRTTLSRAGLVLLVLAAALYVLAWYPLATTGE